MVPTDYLVLIYTENRTSTDFLEVNKHEGKFYLGEELDERFSIDEEEGEWFY